MQPYDVLADKTEVAERYHVLDNDERGHETYDPMTTHQQPQADPDVNDGSDNRRVRDEFHPLMGDKHGLLNGVQRTRENRDNYKIDTRRHVRGIAELGY